MVRPTIVQPPLTQMLPLVQPVNLTCQATGNPPPMYQWYRDGEVVSGANLSYLYIHEVAPSDRGEYTCIATNQAGSVSSLPGLLLLEGEYS